MYLTVRLMPRMSLQCVSVEVSPYTNLSNLDFLQGAIQDLMYLMGYTGPHVPHE